jgi:hypothetical protein
LTKKTEGRKSRDTVPLRIIRSIIRGARVGAERQHTKTGSSVHQKTVMRGGVVNQKQQLVSINCCTGGTHSNAIALAG